MTNRIIVLLGSNIEKERNLPSAVAQLSRLCSVIATSSVYETCPVGLEDQPRFFNAAVLVETALDAYSFRDEILDAIERNLGRVRTSDKNAPRTIDTDIILFNEEVLDLDSDHHIPDPDLLKYRHVVIPIAEISPNLIHPETGETLSSIASRLVEEARLQKSYPVRRRFAIDLGATRPD
jgi:2-amino-4-hydroxy-6-hydroxymethyldihydropteridine diphosphokinase